MKTLIAFIISAPFLAAIFTSCKKELFRLPEEPISNHHFESFKRTMQDLSRPNLPVVPVPETGVVQQLVKGKELKIKEGPTVMEMIFRVSVNGNIRSLKINLPEVGDKAVSLWNMDERKLVSRQVLSCKNINSWENSKPVNIELKAGVIYMLAFKTDNYYYFNAKGGTLPFTSGSSTILEFRSAQKHLDNTSIYEENLSIRKPLPIIQAFGFVDFSFQAYHDEVLAAQTEVQGDIQHPFTSIRQTRNTFFR